jgi:hypothetical protein
MHLKKKGIKRCCAISIWRHSISTYASEGEGGVISSYAYAFQKMRTGGGGV